MRWLLLCALGAGLVRDRLPASVSPPGAGVSTSSRTSGLEWDDGLFAPTEEQVLALVRGNPVGDGHVGIKELLTQAGVRLDEPRLERAANVHNVHDWDMDHGVAEQVHHEAGGARCCDRFVPDAGKLHCYATDGCEKHGATEAILDLCDETTHQCGSAEFDKEVTAFGERAAERQLRRLKRTTCGPPLAKYGGIQPGTCEAKRNGRRTITVDGVKIKLNTREYDAYCEKNTGGAQKKCVALPRNFEQESGDVAVNLVGQTSPPEFADERLVGGAPEFEAPSRASSWHERVRVVQKQERPPDRTLEAVAQVASPRRDGPKPVAVEVLDTGRQVRSREYDYGSDEEPRTSRDSARSSKAFAIRQRIDWGLVQRTWEGHTDLAARVLADVLARELPEQFARPRGPLCSKEDLAAVLRNFDGDAALAEYALVLGGSAPVARRLAEAWKEQAPPAPPPWRPGTAARPCLTTKSVSDVPPLLGYVGAAPAKAQVLLALYGPARAAPARARVQELQDEAGNRYYSDHDTRTTSWVPPDWWTSALAKYPHLQAVVDARLAEDKLPPIGGKYPHFSDVLAYLVQDITDSAEETEV